MKYRVLGNFHPSILGIADIDVWFFIEAMNKPNHIHALIWKSKNIMNITDIPSGCVSPM